MLIAVGESAIRGPDATPYDGLRRWAVALLGTQPGLVAGDARPSIPAPGARLPPARTEAVDVDAAAPVVSEDPPSEPEAVDAGAPGPAESGDPTLAPATSPAVSDPPDSPAERAPPPLTASPSSPTLYQGLIPEGARATLVAWDGRGADGGVVKSGCCEVHVVSHRATNAGASAPVRKVVLGLTVDADHHRAPIVATPFLVGGESGIPARGGRSPQAPVRPEVDLAPPDPPAIGSETAAPTRPILTIRAGQLRRTEMDGRGP